MRGSPHSHLTPGVAFKGQSLPLPLQGAYSFSMENTSLEKVLSVSEQQCL